MLNQKGFVNIILIVLVVVLAGVVGYFAFIKKQGPIFQEITTEEGIFFIIYGDPIPGSDRGSILYILIDNDGKLTRININSITSIIGVDGVIDLVKKRVIVTGRRPYPEKDILEATSIKLIEDAKNK